MGVYKQVIVVRSDLEMPKGKFSAQVAHGSLMAYKKADGKTKKKWEEEGGKKVVLEVNNLKELLEILEEAQARELPVALVEDAGRTYFKEPTKTCVGIGPEKEKEIDKVTGKLKMI